MTNNYNASQIQVLKGLEAVRKNPGMYVEDSDKKGLHRLVWEILDNSVDEAMGGHANEINITVHADGETVTIEDNGRGIPTDMHPTEKISALEVVLTTLHAGGKFGGSGYEQSGGLHGVGAACVNALSDEMIATVHRDGYLWVQHYSQGIPKGKVKKERALEKKEKQHGTSIQWHPDKEIFVNGIKLDENILLRRFREVAFLNRGLQLNYVNKKTGTQETFKYEGGIVDYLQYLSELKGKVYPAEPICGESKADMQTRSSQMFVQFAMNYSEDGDEEVILSFVNNINTVDGGTHTSGFKTALTRVVNNFARSMNLLKEKDANLSGDDVREGMTCIISVRISRPEFTSQAKTKLGTAEVDGVVNTVVHQLLTSYFDKNAAIVKRIAERAILAQQARTAAKKQSDLVKRKSAFGKSHRLPGKLYDCNTEKRELSELFIVEGDSAAGSSKDGRDPETQAILPIRGKIINAGKKKLSELLKNKEIQSLVLAIGAGVDSEFELESRRYDKVIIMADADDDGCHIATLLVTFFYRHMQELITQGHLYLAQPPLFCVDHGKSKVYCWTPEEMQEETKKSNKSKVVRFKGLGEMDAEQLASTTMDKDNRRLIQLAVSDTVDCERMISILMGSNVQARKDHIANHTNSVISKGLT